ncbi:protein SHQ1 homolog [Ischnura elegans]|uniref:protein SHQ1 homolog n=1 Tax=Ischnura elegans TaxID=197161 RepID=UPI001ED88AE6|nr:protein SHQ1 homolog [Ischnura elegans]
MLTPRFELTQTDNDIVITIHAPYANIADTEVFVHENDVRFHAAPYYLRLNLPGPVEENDGSRASYDADSGDFTIKLGKMVPGQLFPDLDMITTLLAPSGVHVGSSKKFSPEISIVGGDDAQSDEDGGNQDDSDGDENDWFVEQVPEKEDDPELFSGVSYGFLNSKHSVFSKLEAEFPDLIDLPNPDSTPQSEREKLQGEHELMSFNEGHYLADLLEAHDKDSSLHSVLAYRGPWEREPEQFRTLTEEDLNSLKDFPNKEYLMEEKEAIGCYLGIVDLLFAYAYDQRTTEGEGTVESGWTMTKLSPMLSWLRTFSSLDSVVISCLRRSLCYPLYRHWKLSCKVLNDTRCILHLGKAAILKCLLQIHSIFNGSEPRYVLNQLYIKDYCIWIQKASKNRINSLAEALDKFSPKKKDLGLSLEELEHLAIEAQLGTKKVDENVSKSKKSDKNVANVEQRLAKMTMSEVFEEAVSDSDDSSSYSSSSEYATSSSEETDDDSDSSASESDSASS